MKNFILCCFLLYFACHSGETAFGLDSHCDNDNNLSQTYGEQLGTIKFTTSCNEKASQFVRQGLALLHHMTYAGARKAFTSATETDPDCSAGYWGRSMTFIHPLWSDPPSEEEFKEGLALIQKAGDKGEKTELEKSFIGAATAYYEPGRQQNEKTNLAGFEKAWRKVYDEFSNNPEAATFYALAHLATAVPEDKSYARQKRSAEIAKKVLAKIPDHPGAHHYIIHAYDYTPLAEKALEVARSYVKIAPDIPHALHMPSHIFTRLGLWQESIAMNKRSAAAALKHPTDGKISMHYLHALDYLAYAYLQRAEDEKAKNIMETRMKREESFQPHVAAAYTLAAIPARYALERQQWEEAAALEPRVPDAYPWEKFPAMEAITYFGRALGAARSGAEKTAGQALDKLAELHARAVKSSAYWAKQVEIQRLSAKAWLMYGEGNHQEALNTMRKAAEMEASTEKHPVTPGEILPAHELYADMLLEMKRFRQALDQYLAALERSPNRLNSLYGAGRAAELEGDAGKAAEYYGKLVKITAPGADRERLEEARTFPSRK